MSNQQKVDHDFKQLKATIVKIEDYHDRGELTASILNRAQGKLDELAELYQYSANVGKEKSYLFELQALLCLARGENDLADSWMLQAAEASGNPPEFVSDAANKWYQGYLHDSNAEHTDENEYTPVELGEKVTKQYNKIVEAGRASMVLGWLALIAYALRLGIGGFEPSVALILFIFFIIPLSIYLLLSGSYIKNRFDNKVPKLLVLNGIFSIVLIFGLIPILVAVMSFSAYASYKKLLKANIIPKVDYSKSWYPGKVTIIIFTLLVALFAYATYNYTVEYDDTNGSLETGTTNLYSDTWDTLSTQKLNSDCLEVNKQTLLNLGYEASVANNMCSCSVDVLKTQYIGVNDFNKRATDASVEAVWLDCARKSGVAFN